ncbi:MAG: outer membrane beta-barrel protein [Pseudomonadota bacterium]
MRVRYTIIFFATLIVLVVLHISPAFAQTHDHVLGGFEMNGYVIAVAGWQRFSNDPITANGDDGSYEGPIGAWLPGAVVAGAAAPQPGSNFIGFFIPKVEFDIIKRFGNRARLRADLQFGRPQSGSGAGFFNLEHAYAVVTLVEKYNVELWLGRIGLQAGFEPYQNYYNDTISWSLLWRSIFPPAFITGAQISAVFSDNWSLYVAVGNGAIRDTTAMPKEMPSWVTSLIYSWGEQINESSLVLTGWFGPESNSNRHFTFGCDVTLSWWIAPKWELGLEAEWQRDNGNGGPNTDYAAALLNLHWDFAPKWYGVFKYAYGQQFDVGNGVINKTGAKQQIHEHSLALGYYIADSAKLKLEGRFDVVAPAGGRTQYVGGTAIALNYAF